MHLNANQCTRTGSETRELENCFSHGTEISSCKIVVVVVVFLVPITTVINNPLLYQHLLVRFSPNSAKTYIDPYILTLFCNNWYGKLPVLRDSSVLHDFRTTEKKWVKKSMPEKGIEPESAAWHAYALPCVTLAL